jgi:uncharacterized protein YdaU (DUF1376 family)
MHYYKRDIGKYLIKAGRLSMLQHGAYTLLMDSCYDRERFPTHDEALEWAWASNPDEICAVEFVLSKFFSLENGVFIQKDIQEDLLKYKDNAAINKQIAIERETKRRELRTNRAPIVHEPPRSEHEPPPNYELRTKNQELEIKNSKSKTYAIAKRLPNDWSPSPEDIQFCKNQRPDLNPLNIADEFRDYWIAIAGTKGKKTDWPATWRNWVRKQNGFTVGKQSKHSNFSQIDYTKGVNENGEF